MPAFDIDSGASKNSAMTAWVRRLPFALDPLIAEAKRRARRRRLLGAVLLIALAGGARGAVVALSGPTAAHGSAPVVRAATRTPLPPLSSLAARATFCWGAFNSGRYGGCHSPDGKWSIHVDHRIDCSLTVSRIGTSRRAVVRPPGPCAPALWVRHRFLIDERVSQYSLRLASLDPASRKVTVLARLGRYIVSPNERWIAGETPSRGSYDTRLIVVMSLTSHTCRVVTRATSRNQYISALKSPWSFAPLPGTPHPRYRPAPHWRTVRQDGRKIRVVSGPGTGFTRDSRSLIIATWRPVKGFPFAAHRRLVEFSLSSLHTPCPVGLPARG
jgi:hypothetical protein